MSLLTCPGIGEIGCVVSVTETFGFRRVVSLNIEDGVVVRLDLEFGEVCFDGLVCFVAGDVVVLREGLGSEELCVVESVSELLSLSSGSGW